MTYVVCYVGTASYRSFFCRNKTQNVSQKVLHVYFYPYCCDIQLKFNRFSLLYTCSATFYFSPHQEIISLHHIFQSHPVGYNMHFCCIFLIFFALKQHCFKKMMTKQYALKVLKTKPKKPNFMDMVLETNSKVRPWGPVSTNKLINSNLIPDLSVTCLEKYCLCFFS